MLVLMYLAYRMMPAKVLQWKRLVGITFWMATSVTAIYLVLGIIYLLFRILGTRSLF